MSKQLSDLDCTGEGSAANEREKENSALGPPVRPTKSGASGTRLVNCATACFLQFPSTLLSPSVSWIPKGRKDWTKRRSVVGWVRVSPKKKRKIKYLLQNCGNDGVLR